MTSRLEYGVLGSGSTGNGIWLRGDGALIVDAGFSVRTTLARLKQLDADPSEVGAIVLTHEHSDHAGGAGRLARHLGVPVIATPGTLNGLRDTDGFEKIPLRPGHAFGLGGFTVEFFPVPHDAMEPVGVRVRHGGLGFGVLTDSGGWDASTEGMLRDLDAVYVESNHDEDMLANGVYPEPLKRRIRGRHGHLSNSACARLLARIVTQRTRRVILGHLSLHNNTTPLALATNHAMLARHGPVTADLVASTAYEAVGPYDA